MMSENDIDATLPDYCRKIVVRDANGAFKELIFPKALDLDRPKRARTTFSNEQLLALEEAFQGNRYLIGKDRNALAEQLKLSEKQVKVWFQNRRTKHRRDSGKASPRMVREQMQGDDSSSGNIEMETRCKPINEAFVSCELRNMAENTTTGLSLKEEANKPAVADSAAFNSGLAVSMPSLMPPLCWGQRSVNQSFSSSVTDPDLFSRLAPVLMELSLQRHASASLFMMGGTASQSFMPDFMPFVARDKTSGIMSKYTANRDSAMESSFYQPSLNTHQS